MVLTSLSRVSYSRVPLAVLALLPKRRNAPCTPVREARTPRSIPDAVSTRGLANKKNHPEGWCFLLVEAAGIEPASADPLPLALHAYPVFVLTKMPTDEKASILASPII
jgi:hypothetical protein